MEIIVFKHRPEEYLGAYSTASEKITDLNKLINLVNDKRIITCRIDVYADIGSRSPSSYKCTLKPNCDKPQSFNDFIFDHIGE